jgi:hypothetical protein
MVASKSLASRRFRPSQAKHRSTTPATRMDGEADLFGRLAHDLDGDARRIRDTLGGIGAVGKGALDKREAGVRGLQQGRRAVAVLDGGGMDLEHERPSVGIDHDVALAAQNL